MISRGILLKLAWLPDIAAWLSKARLPKAEQPKAGLINHTQRKLIDYIQAWLWVFIPPEVNASCGDS